MEQAQNKRVLKAAGLSWWQVRAFFSAGILYLFFYFCKYDFGAAIPGIQEEFGFTDKAIGWVLTAFLWVYALGQFINGFLGDRYGPKRIIILGALGGIIVNVTFAFGGRIAGFVGLGSLAVFIVLWSVNG